MWKRGDAACPSRRARSGSRRPVCFKRAAGVCLRVCLQPALVFIVPACLGSSVALACVRGRLREMWRGEAPLDAHGVLLVDERHNDGERMQTPQDQCEGAEEADGVSTA